MMVELDEVQGCLMQWRTTQFGERLWTAKDSTVHIFAENLNRVRSIVLCTALCHSQWPVHIIYYDFTVCNPVQNIKFYFVLCSSVCCVQCAAYKMQCSWGLSRVCTGRIDPGPLPGPPGLVVKLSKEYIYFLNFFLSTLQMVPSQPRHNF